MTVAVCAVRNVNSTSATTPTLSLRVEAKDCGAGFFAFMLYAINQILYAERHSLIPHVLFGERCRDGRLNRYFVASHGPNMWGYFFDPLSSVMTGDSDVQLTGHQLFALHHTSTKSVQTYPHGVYRHLKSPRWRYDESWFRLMRGRADSVLRRWVRLRPEPLHVVTTFYRNAILARGLQRPLLGLHVRGTDKLRNIGGRIISPAEYHPLIRRFLSQRPDALVFLATDSPSFLRQMRKAYGDTLVFYDALRSERNAFVDRSVINNYKKGEDALVEALLLSCANLLIKPASALSEFAVYWNPALHNHTVELQFEEGVDAGAAIAQHFGSPRDIARGFERCAPAVAIAAGTG